MIVSRNVIVNRGLWRLWKPIEVPAVADIPGDWPGPMGVPITFMGKWDREQFELIDIIRPFINGRQKYQRLIIRNLRPDIPDAVELQELQRKRTPCGADLITVLRPGTTDEYLEFLIWCER